MKHLSRILWSAVFAVLLPLALALWWMDEPLGTAAAVVLGVIASGIALRLPGVCARCDGPRTGRHPWKDALGRRRMVCASCAGAVPT